MEYDSSSSEDLDDESNSTNNDQANDVDGIPSLDHEATFLLRVVSGFGRTVRFNSGIKVSLQRIAKEAPR